MQEATKTQDIDTLNHLTSLCFDSAKGYREAAGTTKNTSLAELYRTRADERDQIAEELQEEASRHGGSPAEHGTLGGAIHRVALNVMALVGDDTKVAINEVERGEDVIKAAFEKAMQRTDICDRVRTLVTQTYSTIKAGHDQASALKHAAA